MVGGLLSQAEEDILEDLDLILGSVTVLLCDHGQDVSSDSDSIFLILSIYFLFHFHYELRKKEMPYSVLHNEKRNLKNNNVT